MKKMRAEKEELRVKGYGAKQKGIRGTPGVGIRSSRTPAVPVGAETAGRSGSNRIGG